MGVQPLADQLDLAENGGCILSYNGARIATAKPARRWSSMLFRLKLAGPVCELAHEAGIVALTYDAQGILTEDPDNPYVQEEARINGIPARKVENLAGAVTFPVNKFLLVGDPERMPHAEELMQQRFAGKLSIYRSQPFFIETMPLGVEKAASLALLLRTMGLFDKNLMACGDGWNDLPMIEYAGLGVAMGNAVPPVKAAARLCHGRQRP